MMKPCPPYELGDLVHGFLQRVGVTEERVRYWIGKHCDCAERRNKLNALGNWAKQFVDARLDTAQEMLARILND